MGDRANVYLPGRHRTSEEDERGVYLYTHWGGDDLPLVLKAALSRGEERWDDPPYLARIVFCQMVDSETNFKSLTGFGISTELTDNKHPIIRVDVGAQTVSWESCGPWSFTDYVALTDEQIQAVWR